MAKYLKSTDFIGFSVKDRIARIILNRPGQRNALAPQMVTEMHQAFIEADALVDVNVIVLEGAGQDFCVGHDLKGIYAGRKANDEARAGGAEEARYRSIVGTIDDDCWSLEMLQRETQIVFEIHKPVIAKVHGNCLAGGTDLALSCDLVIAADDARIGYPATRGNGSPPSQWWIYHCGPQWAKRLLLTGDSISGLDAAKIGLVLDAVPADQLEAEVAELARRIALIDNELLAAHKRIVNLALELEGARAVQRLACEMDARARASIGPRRTQFKADMAEFGLKQALRNRDEPFGDGMAKPHW